jgi:hypothetical protein
MRAFPGILQAKLIQLSIAAGSYKPTRVLMLNDLVTTQCYRERLRVRLEALLRGH